MLPLRPSTRMPLDQSTLVSLGSTLPPSFHVFLRLDERLRDPIVDVSDLVALIRVDPSLVFKLLRLANSVMYGSSRPCESLDEAVTRVGMREIQRLVGLAAVHQAYQHDLANYRLPAQRLWQNSVATAVSVEALSSLSAQPVEGGYAAGLMRNLGRMILDRVRGKEPYPGEQVEPDLATWEEQTFGSDACEVGSRLLEHWHFPPDVVGMVRDQLNPLVATERGSEAALMNLAGHLTLQLGASLPGEASRWAPSPEKLLVAGLDEEALSTALEMAREPYTRVCEAFAALSKAAA